LVEQKGTKCFIIGKNYFYPGCPNYDNVKVEIADDEWFCSESEAKKAGYQKAELCT
jgi:hypothetical protein